jgi:formylglycine-generating enzyme required for sulfatase activity
MMGVNREEDWVDISAGSFYMGSSATEAERGNELRHNVKIAAFKMLRTPVTYFMYDKYCEVAGKAFPEYDGKGLKENRPVTNVSYWDAVDYCIWLSKQIGYKCVLPTEAQWEYACRAGTTTPFYTGETISVKEANFKGELAYNGAEKEHNNWTSVIPVAFYSPNPWGLYDMHGNINEWCSSLYENTYSGAEQQDASEDRANNHDRVMRGGAFDCKASLLRSASRLPSKPDDKYLANGFRIARILD